MTLWTRETAPAGTVTMTEDPNGNFTLTTPAGGLHWDPVPVGVAPGWPAALSSPPAVGELFLPNPDATLWTPKVQHDFRTMKSLPADTWSYGGRPGGVPAGCIWTPSMISFDPVLGLIMTASWSAAQEAWLCAAFGTAESVPAPWYFRGYEALLDVNLDLINHLMLAWNEGAGWSNECDGLEYSIVKAIIQASIARMHNGSNANVTPPITSNPPELLGQINVHEMWVDNRSGTPTYGIKRNGVLMGSATIPQLNYGQLESTPHWQGFQSQFYGAGDADTTKTSKRAILGAEIYVAAA